MLKAGMIFSYPELVLQSLVSLVLWYCTIFILCIPLGRIFFNRKDAMSLLLNVELRNLPIAIGIAVTSFSPQTAMIVALAFLFQQQFAIWFWKFDKRFGLLGPKCDSLFYHGDTEVTELLSAAVICTQPLTCNGRLSRVFVVFRCP